jgi:hypothetical protein
MDGGENIINKKERRSHILNGEFAYFLYGNKQEMSKR